MGASPKTKVFDADGKYQASVRDEAAAAVLVAWYGTGATIRDGHSKGDIVFEQGIDGDAAESYDEVARIIEVKRRVRWAKARSRYY